MLVFPALNRTNPEFIPIQATNCSVSYLLFSFFALFNFQQGCYHQQPYDLLCYSDMVFCVNCIQFWSPVCVSSFFFYYINDIVTFDLVFFFLQLTQFLEFASFQLHPSIMVIKNGKEFLTVEEKRLRQDRKKEKVCSNSLNCKYPKSLFLTISILFLVLETLGPLPLRTSMGHGSWRLLCQRRCLERLPSRTRSIKSLSLGRRRYCRCLR